MLDILTILADQARLDQGDGEQLGIVHGGHRMRITVSGARNAAMLLIDSERIALSSTRSGATRFQTKLTPLVALPSYGRTWSRSPKIRWPQVQAFLHDHAGRPAQLQYLLTAMFLQMPPMEAPSYVEFHSAHRPEKDVVVGGQLLPFAQRVHDLKIQTACMDRDRDTIVANTHPLIPLSVPASLHARMEFLDRHGTGPEQLERLEAAWLHVA